MNVLEQLRNFVRYKTHGGYRWAAVMRDGALMCEHCVKDNYRQVYTATRDADGSNSDWQVIGLTDSGESEETEFCAQCNKLLWESQT